MTDPPTLQAVIGARVRAIRGEAQITQDALATAARRYGLKWTTARVGELERGDRGIPVGELLVLAQCLGELSGNAIAIRTLIYGAPAIAVTSDLVLSPRAIGDALSGVPVSFDESQMPASPTRFMDALQREIDRMDFPLVKRELQAVAAILEARSLTEERAERALGISPLDLARYSHNLWGRSLTQERDRRSLPSSNVNHRGHVTRQLVEELRTRLESDRAR